jgi:CcmD family protein
MRALVAAWLMGVSLAFAAPLAAQEAAGDRAASFEAVSGAVREDVPGGPLMVAAYALIWVAVLGYVFRLVRLHKNVDENLSRLQQDLAKATKHLETQK